MRGRHIQLGLRHVALVDPKSNRDGDVVECLCGKRQRGYRNPARTLLACSKCMVALERAYTEAVDGFTEAHKSLSLIALLADVETSVRTVKTEDA